MVDLVARQFADDAAVAQADHAIGAGLHLAKPVGDVDHRHPVRPQLRDHLQQPVGFRQRQAGGRLVHDDDARIDRQRLGDLHQLPLRDRQSLDRRVRAEIGAQPSSSGATCSRRRLRLTSISGPPLRGSRPMNMLAATSRFSKRFSSWCTKAMPARIDWFTLSVRDPRRRSG